MSPGGIVQAVGDILVDCVSVKRFLKIVFILCSTISFRFFVFMIF